MSNKIMIGIIILLCIGIIICLFFYKTTKKEEEPTTQYTSILDLEEYKDLSVDKIESITVKRYTEGGLEENTKDTQEEIEEIFNRISKYQVGEETNQACEDNTTIYEIKIKDQEEPIKIEIECDWIILGNKRYLIKKESN